MVVVCVQVHWDPPHQQTPGSQSPLFKREGGVVFDGQKLGKEWLVNAKNYCAGVKGGEGC